MASLPATRRRSPGQTAPPRGELPVLPVNPVLMLRELTHRLRTPLATIHGYASLLEAHLAEGSEPTRCLEWSRRIQSEIERATELLGDLSLARAASQGVQGGAVDLRSIVSEAVAQVARDAERTVPLEPGPPVPSRGDSTLLHRAAYHLVLLGLQSGRDVRVRVEAGARAATVEVAWTPGGTGASENDPWLLFCRVVARAHEGEIELQPTRLVMLLRGCKERAA